MNTEQLRAEWERADAAFKKASNHGYRADLDYAAAYAKRAWLAALRAEKAVVR